MYLCIYLFPFRNVIIVKIHMSDTNTSGYSATRNSEAEVAPPKRKGDPALIPYVTKEFNR